MTKAIWILAGAAAALAAAAPASAQRAGTAPAFASSGHGGARTHFGNPRFGFGRDRRCARARFAQACFRGSSFGIGRGLLGWGGGLVEDPDSVGRDDGFFAGPAEVRAAHGGAYYDYDRSYPYDWYHERQDTVREGPRIASAEPAVHCDVTWVPGRTGERAPVRVCRGRR